MTKKKAKPIKLGKKKKVPHGTSKAKKKADAAILDGMQTGNFIAKEPIANPPGTFYPDLIRKEATAKVEPVAQVASKPIARALSAKQEKFCHCIVEGMNQGKAYEHCYEVKKMSMSAVYREASVLMDNPKITGRLLELRAPVLEKLEITEEFVLTGVKAIIERCMQISPVVDSLGQAVLVEAANGTLVPAFRFDPMGALKGHDMLAKHLGLYEKDNRQQQVLENLSIAVTFVDAPKDIEGEVIEG